LITRAELERLRQRVDVHVASIADQHGTRGADAWCAGCRRRSPADWGAEIIEVTWTRAYILIDVSRL
jgi:hypothetical protein